MEEGNELENWTAPSIEGEVGNTADFEVSD